MKTFASFVVAWIDDKLCGTTREDGTYGLPGGKLEDGESPQDAAIRESREEGWEVELICNEEISTQVVDGKQVQWFAARVLRPLENYKESKRGIRPILLTRQEVIESGMGNDKIGI